MTNCNAGTYNSQTGQSTSSACSPCTAGYYCSGGSTSAQAATCPTGYYCPEGTGLYTAYPCPVGTYGSSSGLYDSSQCTRCPTGYYCTGGSSRTACGTGTYQPYTGATSSSACTSCPAGWACPSTATSTVTVKCSAGYYCSLGSTSATTNGCPSGTYSDSTNLTRSQVSSRMPVLFQKLDGIVISDLSTVSPQKSIGLYDMSSWLCVPNHCHYLDINSQLPCWILLCCGYGYLYLYTVSFWYLLEQVNISLPLILPLQALHIALLNLSPYKQDQSEVLKRVLHLPTRLLL